MGEIAVLPFRGAGELAGDEAGLASAGVGNWVLSMSCEVGGGAGVINLEAERSVLELSGGMGVLPLNCPVSDDAGIVSMLLYSQGFYWLEQGF